MVIGNFSLCCQAPDLPYVFQIEPRSRQMNLKPAVLKNFVFNWACVSTPAKSSILKFDNLGITNQTHSICQASHLAVNFRKETDDIGDLNN